MSNVLRRKTNNTLWTRDFTIISIGSFISMCGNTIISFALGLLVLDYTKSMFLFAMYMVAYTFPMLIVPVFSGPFLDRFSRRKTLYTLDFTSAFLFVICAFFLWQKIFNFPLLIVGCLLLGSIDSIYNVCYDSFYPLLISEGNYQKAYSIASTIETLTAFMVPVSALLYNMIGIVPLFMINAVTFVIVAIAETQIKAKEEYRDEFKQEDIEENHQVFTKERYIRDLKDGLIFLKGEKGLLAIAIYYFFSFISGGAQKVIELPYFKINYNSGEYIYMYVWAYALIGRLIGGAMQYRLNIPSHKKYKIAVSIYLVISILGGIYLFMPLGIMTKMYFIIGFFGIISYNIRVSSTQSYVPNQIKGRFNGAFRFLTTGGFLLGELLSGIMVNWIDSRIVLFIFMSITFLSVIVIMGSNKTKVVAIYNRK